MKQCQVDSCNYPVFSHNFCKFHQNKRTDKKYLQSKRWMNVKKGVGSDTIQSKRIKYGHSVKGISIKPKWNLLVIMRWYNSTPNVCFECGEPLGYFSRHRTHHLIHQQDWAKYAIDIVNDPRNLVKLGSIWDCGCHGQVHSNIDKTPKVKALTQEVKAVFEKYRKV